MSNFTPLPARASSVAHGDVVACAALFTPRWCEIFHTRLMLHRTQANGPVPLKKGSWFGVSPQWSNIRWCSRRRLAFKQLSHLVIAHAFQIPPSQHSSEALRITHLAHAAQHLLPQPVGPPEVLSHVAHVV